MLLPIFTSCGWEDLPSYEEADITGVQFRYRWKSDVYKDDITGEPLILEMQMGSQPKIDAEAGTIEVTVNVPNPQSYFTSEVRETVEQNNLVGQVTLSTAARIAPADGHKVLGRPDDWTVPHNFVVTAADGTKKNWTITVVAFNK